MNTIESDKILFEKLIQANPNALADKLPSLKAPTLVFWGEKDKIFDVSGAQVAKSLLKNGQVHLFKETGHVPVTERPEQSYQLMIDFFKKIK